MSTSTQAATQFDWIHNKCTCVVGETGSGKSATCYSILENVGNSRTRFVYKHPRPELIEGVGLQNLEELSLDHISDCFLYIDEPQLVFVSNADRQNLLRIFSLARQRDVNLLISTSDTRWVTVSMEAYVDCYVVKSLDYDSCKRGSKIKKIIAQSLFNIDPQSFRLPPNEAILFCRRWCAAPKKMTVPLPSFWSEQFSKPYKESLFDQGAVEEFFPFGDM
jgi:hypothetical protein